MTAYLAYSYSTGLSENEAVAIDKQVCRNREFVTKFPLNAKRKAKRLYLYVMFTFAISQPLAPCAAVVLPPLTAIHRLHSIDESRITTNGNCLQIAPVIRSKVDKVKLTNEQIEQFDIIAKQLISGSITMEEAILQLRGGSFEAVEAGVVLSLLIWALANSNAGAFVSPGAPLPHMDPIGWLNGKYDFRNAGNPQSMANPPSRFERDTLHTMKQMCANSRDENGFVMSYEDAYKLVKATYSDSLKITNEQNIDYWQACKKIYHAIDFSINPEDYGMNQKQLMKISDPGGLIRYVQEGNPLPPIEFVQKFASTIKDSCLSDEAFKNENGSHKVKGVEQPTVIFSIEANREKITFDKETGSFVSGQRVRLKSFNQYLQSIDNYPGKN